MLYRCWQRDMNLMPKNNPNQNRRFCIEGAELGYPTLFNEGSTSIGMFVVSSKIANELIADSGFTVAEIAPNKTILNLACVHYTDTECGSYEEIGCAFFVNRYLKKRSIPYLSTWLNIIRGRQPSFTWFLPVTAKAALECGIQMWGYPKTIEDIRHHKTDSHTITSLYKDAEEVLRFSVGNNGNKAIKPMSNPVYSIFEQRPHVGYLSQQFSDVTYSRAGQLILSDHPIVEPLRRLGLPKKPLMTGHMGKLRFSMSAPELLF
jgi:hypothetical protein